LLVYNPDKPQHERELERWYSYFAIQQNLKESQCLIFAHHKPNAPQVPLQPLASQKLSGIQCIHTDLEEDPNSVREEFSAFLLALLTSSQDRQEQEEQGIINTQH